MDEGDIKISVNLKEKCHNVPERTHIKQVKKFRLLKEIKENGD